MAGVSSSLMGRSSGAFLLRFRGREHDPPCAMDFHKAAADLQGGEILPSDGTQSEQGHHQPIANLTCSGKLGQVSRVFGLV